MYSRILVTGGAGFIGSRLAKSLIAQGKSVVVADNLSTGKRENLPSECDFIEIDLANPAEYRKFNGVEFDAVCHLAAQSSGEASFLNPRYDFSSHALSIFNLLEFCKERGVKRFLYASSMATYGDPVYQPVDENHPQNPKTYYAAGKLAAESYVKFYQSQGFDTTVFRLFSVYGPGQDLDNKLQGMVSIFLSFIFEGKPIHVKGAKERFRDFTYVDDVIAAWLLALENPVSFCKTYNISTEKKTTVEELLLAMTSSVGKPDYPVVFEGTTPGDQFGVFGSSKKIREELGWEPHQEFVDGMKTMVASYKKLG